MHSGLRVAALLCVLVLIGVGGVGVAAAGDEVAPDGETNLTAETGETETIETERDQRASVSGSRTIELTQELRRTPERLGEYDARHRYRIPDGVTQLEVRLPEDATVTARSGFVEREGKTYAWDGSTQRPTITYRVPADRTVDRDDPIAGPGQYLFVDRGEWSLVLGPQTGHSWGWTGGSRVGFDQTTTVDGDGAASDAIAFLGPHEEYRHTAHGQTFRLIVPEAADLEEEPEEIFASLEHASNALRVGERDREVFIVAAPTGDVQWGVRGLQTGPADMWVRDFESLDEADNVWLHEYVHTRQDYNTAESTRWFTEGTAVYYATLLTLEQDRIEFDEFRTRLQRGGEHRFRDVRLVDRGTWRANNGDYHVGALVAGELDRQIRLASDRERSFQDVFARMNAHDGAVDASTFERFVREAGGSDTGRAAERYTHTADRPAVWSVSQHREAFGTLPAQFGYELGATDDAYRVSGPYRTRSLSEPLVVVPGESLELDATVRNVGGTAGDYEATFRIDGRVVEQFDGRLAPDETAGLTASHHFDEAGEYTIALGDATVPVSVREPATANVIDVSVEPAEIKPGERVTLSVTVANDADYPGRLEVPVTKNGVEVDRQTVRLDAEEADTLTVERTIDESGEYTFGLGEASAQTVAVVVTEDDSEPAPAEPTPGFTALPALVGLVLTAVVLARRR